MPSAHPRSLAPTSSTTGSRARLPAGILVMTTSSTLMVVLTSTTTTPCQMLVKSLMLHLLVSSQNGVPGLFESTHRYPLAT